MLVPGTPTPHGAARRRAPKITRCDAADTEKEFLRCVCAAELHINKLSKPVNKLKKIKRTIIT